MPTRICVFCGSSQGTDPAFTEAARQMGQALAQQEIGLVYGGGSIGLMGTLADAALEAGGEVTGIIPEALSSAEVAHGQLSALQVVPDMHIRKARMASLADGFIALPGGIGTFEELFEVWTWAQLGYHSKPIALLNVAGFYDPLLEFLNHTLNQGFIRPGCRDLLQVHTEIETLLAQLLPAALAASPNLASNKI
ncbi:MAG: TIGR00730 family Rossman fold protein [Oceanospirillaceae bacterium]|uniref:LOG family protein n=1 Tax=Marinobacterium litorale TaxID=404770 RepID=UPI00040DA0BD|nr:TIGR00730 family Rossman fold protein [Marinobacterium litorale]MBS98842.1 TIGR00730 family Rossman fold protein [Oceanospirillaceae bacterium]